MSDSSNQKQDNQRQNFRLSLGSHVLGHMSIYKVGDKIINSPQTEVCIIDLGAGGIRFRTSLNMPVNKNAFLSVEMVLLNQHFRMVGNLVRKIPNEDGTFDYGLKSLADEEEKTPWVKVLNNLIVMQKVSPWKIKYTACKCSKA